MMLNINALNVFSVLKNKY